MVVGSEFLAKFLVPGYLLASMDPSDSGKLVLGFRQLPSPTGSEVQLHPGGKPPSLSRLPPRGPLPSHLHGHPPLPRAK